MVVGDDNAKSRINWNARAKGSPQEEAPGPADSLHYRVLMIAVVIVWIHVPMFGKWTRWAPGICHSGIYLISAMRCKIMSVIMGRSASRGL